MCWFQVNAKARPTDLYGRSLQASEVTSSPTLSFLIPWVSAPGDHAPHLQRLAEMQILMSPAAAVSGREGAARYDDIFDTKCR